MEQVNLTPEAEEAVILFCREHEEQLSYKSVINCVKDLKYKVSSSLSCHVILFSLEHEEHLSHKCVINCVKYGTSCTRSVLVCLIMSSCSLWSIKSSSITRSSLVVSMYNFYLA